MILHAYLAAWLLLTAASVGGIAWQAIHRLTGGAWGDDLASRWGHLRRLLPLAALAAVPLLLGAHHLFPWMDAPVDEARLWYLDRAFLVWRTAGCFLAWAIAWALLRRAAAASLILWLFACGMFGNDWIVSLSADWRSSVIGLVVATSSCQPTTAARARAFNNIAFFKGSCGVGNDGRDDERADRTLAVFEVW